MARLVFVAAEAAVFSNKGGKYKSLVLVLVQYGLKMVE